MSGLLERPRRRRGKRIPVYFGDPERLTDYAVGRYLVWLRRGSCSDLARELAVRDAIERVALERFRRSEPEQR